MILVGHWCSVWDEKTLSVPPCEKPHNTGYVQDINICDYLWYPQLDWNSNYLFLHSELILLNI